ncbi:MAG: flagellar basal body P-ring formation protein FlgA [Desulfarculus sp.]|nr:flagellar basal body P-ring formation protein FlgA [Desulfarculus sp.]
MKHQRSMAMTVLALALWAWPAPAPAAEVLNFAASAQVSGARLTLLDLAAPYQDLSPALAERLRQISLGSSPALGRQTTVPGLRLRSLVRQANLGPGVSVFIPEQVVVERASQKLTSQDLEKLYHQAVAERLGPKARQADIHDVVTSREIILPAGQLSTQARILTGQVGEVSGRVPVTIDVYVDGIKEAQVRVVGSVDLYGQVVVASRPLMAGQVLTPEDMEVRRVNLGEAGPGVVSEPAQLAGYRTRLPVAAGAPLDSRRLEQAPLVHTGDVVTMIFNGQGIKVSAKGKAEQTGFLNSRIRLVNLASKRGGWGKVVDSGTVEVDF